jgi:hypothetical protein
MTIRRSTRLLGLLLLWLTGAKGGEVAGLPLHIVAMPVSSYRLLAMSMDDDGFIWCGSIHRVVHRYDPRSGQVETLQMPYDSSASSCLCVGKKVYILGQSYPRLIVYDRSAGKFSELAYPSPKPDVWYGVGPIDKYLYLFDRGCVGVIQWNTETDSGTVIPYPYGSEILPSGGHYEPGDRAIWCKLWDYSTGQYIPRGIARLDLEKNEFDGRWEFPKEDELPRLEPVADSTTTFYLPWSLKGKLVPFDYKAKRWCKSIDVPRFGELFGFIGLSTPFRGKQIFSISTYDGDNLGIDGKPYHFCNAVLEFDPRTQQFSFPTLNEEATSGKYFQVSYTMVAGEHFFATGSNIREPDGTLNQARAGECVFWQTLAPTAEKTAKPH